MGLRSRGEGNPSMGVNPTEIRVDKPVINVKCFSSAGNTNN